MLQAGVEYLYRLQQDGSVTELRLGAPPAAIGSLPAGGFFITHDAALGLVSFFDPTTEEIVEVGGFAALGWFGEIDLLQEEG